MISKAKKIVLSAIGLLSLAFYFTCVHYAHAGVSWLWLWLMLTGFCLVRVLMLQFNIHPPKWMRIIYYCGVVLFLAVFITVEGLIVSAMTNEVPAGLDYVITLGAAVRNGVPTSPLRYRIQRTAEYLLENPDTVAIASGGQGPAESMSEAECIREYLLEYGIDDSRIIVEDKSTDTEANIDNSYKFIPEGSSVGVVSNSYHLYRAIRIAELRGHEVEGIPAITLLPLGIHYTVREFFAVIELEIQNLI